MMTPPQIIVSLRTKTPLFAKFTDDQLRALVDGSRVASFETSEAILHSGDEAAHLGVVLSGTVAASVLGEGAARQTLGRLEAGDTFNEMALMTADRVVADFIAESRS